MQKKIKKNIKQRYVFQNFEKNRLILKIISKNLNIKKKNKMEITTKMVFFSSKFITDSN